MNKKSKHINIPHNELTETAKISMKARIIGAICFFVPLAGSLLLGDWVFLLLATGVLAIAVFEILGVINKRTVVAYLLYFIILSMIVYWPIFQGLLLNNKVSSWHIYPYFKSLVLPLIVLMSGIFLTFLLVVIYKDVTVRDGCFLCTIGIIVALGLQSMLFLRYYPLAIQEGITPFYGYNYENTVGSSLLIIYVILATCFTDVGAYFIGVFFGKNKMNERISPKKTWEGFAGGVVISAIISLSFALPLAASGRPLQKCLDMEHWYNIVILSLSLPFFATLGDFVFSSIKRYYSVKDYGNLIPGHGGILDRFDSLFFTFIVAAIYIIVATRIITGEGNPLV